MHKDEPLDRLLERTSRARGDAPSGLCLDAETLAAWTEGTLTAHERAAAETHAADCDRCLSVLAALAQTRPPAAPAGARWWSVRWLVPLTTAAVAMTAWLLVQPGPEPSLPAAPSPAPSTIDAAGPAAPAPVVPSRPEAPPPTPTRSEARKQVAGLPPPAALKDQAAGRGAVESTPKAPPTSAEKLGRGSQPSTATGAEASRAAAAVTPPAPVPPLPPSASVRQDATEQPFRAAARQALPTPRVIPSPHRDVQWRVHGSSVDRSSDGGRTWQGQATGTSAELIAGYSPGPAVCWIVGRGGVVLLSTDGETWRRLDFPDAAADLVGVTARDALTATVTAASGRAYHTADGGRTWILQEAPATPF